MDGGRIRGIGGNDGWMGWEDGGEMDEIPRLKEPDTPEQLWEECAQKWNMKMKHENETGQVGAIVCCGAVGAGRRQVQGSKAWRGGQAARSQFHEKGLPF